MAAQQYIRPVPRRTIPIPHPPGFVPQPSTDKQEREYLKNGIIYNGVTGMMIMNADTKQRYYS